MLICCPRQDDQIRCMPRAWATPGWPEHSAYSIDGTTCWFTSGGMLSHVEGMCLSWPPTVSWPRTFDCSVLASRGGLSPLSAADIPHCCLWLWMCDLHGADVTSENRTHNLNPRRCFSIWDWLRACIMQLAKDRQETDLASRTPAGSSEMPISRSWSQFGCFRRRSVDIRMAGWRQGHQLRKCLFNKCIIFGRNRECTTLSQLKPAHRDESY